MSEQGNTLKLRPGNAAPVANPVLFYGILDLGLQQPYELANIIQAFHIQHDLLNLGLPSRAQNAISQHGPLAPDALVGQRIVVRPRPRDFVGDGVAFAKVHRDPGVPRAEPVEVAVPDAVDLVHELPQVGPVEFCGVELVHEDRSVDQLGGYRVPGAHLSPQRG